MTYQTIQSRTKASSSQIPHRPSFPTYIRHGPITGDQHSHGRPKTTNHIGQYGITTKAPRTYWTLFDPGRLTEASDTSDGDPTRIDNTLTLDQTASEAKLVPIITPLNSSTSNQVTTTLTMTESRAYMHRGRSARTIRDCDTHHLPCPTGTSSCGSSLDPACSA